MKAKLAALVGVLSVAMLASAGATNGEKIVGKWTSTQTEGKAIEFTKDGKVTMQEKIGGKTSKVTGTYKLKDKNLSITLPLPGKENGETDLATIKSLTEKELILLVDEKGKSVEFTYKRAK